VRTKLIAAACVAAAAVLGVSAFLVAHQRRSSVASGPPSGPYRGSQPPRGVHTPDFRLRSYRGQVLNSRDLRGKVAVVTFLDTACKDKCPIIAAQIGAGIRLLTRTERANVRALAITVLPPVDTPAHERTFLRERHALNELDWLIGPLPQLRKAYKAFAVLSAAATGNPSLHSAGVRISIVPVYGSRRCVRGLI
jgi:cytochrome oxidase Cu insertion factor (SCO1/SenC/PrrC family)